MTNSELITTKAPAFAVDMRRQAVVLSVLALATFVRIYAVSPYPPVWGVAPAQ